MLTIAARSGVGCLLVCVLLGLLAGQTGEAHAQFSFMKSKQDYELSDVMIEADEFVRLESYWEAYSTSDSGENELLGYVLLSDDLTHIPAYSGETLNTLIGFDLEGRITGIKIVEHSEPIVLLGLDEAVIHEFGAQYIGKNLRERIIISDIPKDGYTTVDAITGATVTAIAGNTTILEASRTVAKQAGLLQGEVLSNRILSSVYVEKGWEDLVAEGAIGHLVVTPENVSAKGEEAVVDLWFTILNPPSIGRNILGPNQERLIAERIAAGEIALYVGSTGDISFKGSGFARGAIFDRFLLEQRGDMFIFKDVDYVNMPSLDAENAPRFDEGGVFFLRAPFDPTLEFVFNLTIPYRVNDVRSYGTFTHEFSLPTEYVDEEVPFWKLRWQASTAVVVTFLLFVGFVVATFLFRMQLARRPRLLHVLRIGTWGTAAVYLGLTLRAQPSTTQMLTFFTSAIHGRFPSEIYLSEPIIFLFWWVIVLSTPLWGRGFFCGCLCPYGALLELLRIPYEKIVPESKRRALDRWDGPDRLRLLKYGILFVILGVSVASLATAEIMAEVEPFKTFILRLMRPAMFVGYFLLVTITSVVVFRAFCRFACPLGAAIALPSKRPVVLLQRYDHCGSCRICEHECLPRAIRRSGEIDHRECFQCWDCQHTMQNESRCPVLIKGGVLHDGELAKDETRARATGRGGSEGTGPRAGVGTLTGLILLLALPLGASATTWFVDSDSAPLQTVVDSAAEGDTVRVAAGVYPGPLHIATRLAVLADDPEGENAAAAIIDGGGKGHVVTIDASGVVLSGFTLRASGDDVEDADAGIWVSQGSEDVTLIDNDILDCRFGIWVHGSPRISIVGNTIVGRAQYDHNSRGDGIHFWDTHFAKVIGNTIEHSRDGIYMELSTDCEIVRNEIRHSRYSVHTMWCDRSTYDDNLSTENLVGLALMFSKGLKARGNTLHNNSTHGLLLIQVTRSVATDNRMIGNTKGLFVYNSLYNTIADNLIANNTLGVHYWAGSEDNEISGNSIVQNKIQVKFVAAKDQEWSGNYWTDYTGWDADGDGRGDTTYRSHTLVDALLWEYPSAKLLLASPAMQLLAGAERNFPVISVPKVVDPSPLMRPSVAEWASILEEYPPLPQTYYGRITKLPHIPGG